jgi:hypothetical protein
LKLKQARLCKKTTFQAPKKMFFHTAFVKLRETRLYKQNNFSGSKKLFFRTALVTLRQARLCKQSIFSGSEKMFFWHCSYETQTSPALQKKTGSKKMCFFSMSLVNCGGNLLAFKIKNLRGPGLQSFG